MDFDEYLEGLVVEHENKEVALSDYLDYDNRLEEVNLSAFGGDYESEVF